MSDGSFDVDPALMAEFLDESNDLLEGLGSLIIEMERNPDNKETMEAIFRPVHSIKGNASFFGLFKVSHLAHELETLLDQLRKGMRPATQELISVLLEGFDALRSIFSRVRSGESELEDEAAYEALMQKVKDTIAGVADDADPKVVWKDVFERFVAIQSQIDDKGDMKLSQNFSALADLIKTLAPEDAVPKTGKKSDSKTKKKGGQGGGDSIDALHELIDGLPEEPSEDMLGELVAQMEILRDENAGEAKALVEEMLADYNAVIGTLGYDPILESSLKEKADKLRDLVPVKLNTSTEEAPGTDKKAEEKEQPAKMPEKKEEKKSQQQDNKTMRIAENQIDVFLSYVGELLVVGDMFNYLYRRMAGKPEYREVVNDFQRANETFSFLSDNLQKSIMYIRKVPMRMLLQKVPRIVRDVASNSNKEIEVEISGEELMADKSLVNLLDAPLTHMVRNAADHGIEPKDVREANGKNPKGKVSVSAEEANGFITLTIQDDGKGLDLERIKDKAMSMGLVKEGSTLTEQDIINFLFASGVSTAEKVTDISGRGVGMDVVRQSIENMGGSISVKTTVGAGSVFEVFLPSAVTTQIIHGFIVRLRDQHFVLPMDRIRSTVRLKKEEVNSVAGKSQCVVLQGHTIPLYDLSQLLDMELTEEQDNYTAVTVEHRKQQAALVVDDVVGLQKVVLRRIEGIDINTNAIAGAAIRGDGSVAMVLDMDELLNSLLKEEIAV